MTDGTGDGQVQGPDELTEWFGTTLGPGADLNVGSPCPEHEGFLYSEITALCFRTEGGMVHAANGPAIYMHETDPCGEAWVRHGELHRDDGPAVQRPPHPDPRPNIPGLSFKARAVEEWWLNGRQHRPDGPAVVFDDGRREWHNIDGKRHREGDEPAVEYPRPYGAYEHGSDRYYKQGHLHRKLGPAVLGFPSRRARYVYTDPEPDQYFFYGVDLDTVCELPAQEVWRRMKNHVSAEADCQDGELFIHPKNSPAWQAASEQGVELYTREFHDNAVRVALALSPNTYE